MMETWRMITMTVTFYKATVQNLTEQPKSELMNNETVS